MGHVDLMIVKANEVITVRGFSEKPAVGDEMRNIGVIPKGAVVIQGGKIIEVGKSDIIEKKYTADKIGRAHV